MSQSKRKDLETFVDAKPLAQATADIPKTRLCLRCTLEFDSSGFGDRICRRCKGTSAWRNGIATTYGTSNRR